MKNTTQIVALVALCLAGVGMTSIALTAIVTRYEGAVDLKVGPTGGQVTIVGSPKPPGLPSASEAASSGR